VIASGGGSVLGRVEKGSGVERVTPFPFSGASPYFPQPHESWTAGHPVGGLRRVDAAGAARAEDDAGAEHEGGHQAREPVAGAVRAGVVYGGGGGAGVAAGRGASREGGGAAGGGGDRGDGDRDGDQAAGEPGAAGARERRAVFGAFVEARELPGELSLEPQRVGGGAVGDAGDPVPAGGGDVLGAGDRVCGVEVSAGCALAERRAWGDRAGVRGGARGGEGVRGWVMDCGSRFAS